MTWRVLSTRLSVNGNCVLVPFVIDRRSRIPTHFQNFSSKAYYNTTKGCQKQGVKA